MILWWSKRERCLDIDFSVRCRRGGEGVWCFRSTGVATPAQRASDSCAQFLPQFANGFPYIGFEKGHPVGNNCLQGKKHQTDVVQKTGNVAVWVVPEVIHDHTRQPQEKEDQNDPQEIHGQDVQASLVHVDVVGIVCRRCRCCCCSSVGVCIGIRVVLWIRLRRVGVRTASSVAAFCGLRRTVVGSACGSVRSSSSSCCCCCCC
mmetsp:Transcript_12675/g.29251  ORF Transcript_12675/g.29251 Transcript_12675/m.29251 type:complete len:204 (+) Transcript_12675:511-1122(+)